MKTDGPGLCCYLCSSFIGRYVPPADVRSAGVPQCPLKRCTLDNNIVPALTFDVARWGCLLCKGASGEAGMETSAASLFLW